MRGTRARTCARSAFYMIGYAGIEEGSDDLSALSNQATYNVGRKISVRIVATNKSSMIAMAIGPPEHRRSDLYHAENGGYSGEHNRAETGTAGIDGDSQAFFP
jgi:hypothetical protein